MNAQDTASTMWAWKQVEAAKKAEASAEACWVADSTSSNWQAWRTAKARTQDARSSADVTVKQVVMQSGAACAW